jgi:hypothetical protein
VRAISNASSRSSTKSSKFFDVGGGEAVHSRDEWRAYCGVFVTAFPDLTQDVRLLVDAGEYAFAEVVARGTHTGPLAAPDGEIAPAGRTIEIPFCVSSARSQWAARGWARVLRRGPPCSDSLAWHRTRTGRGRRKRLEEIQNGGVKVAALQPFDDLMLENDRVFGGADRASSPLRRERQAPPPSAAAVENRLLILSLIFM